MLPGTEDRNIHILKKNHTFFVCIVLFYDMP